MWSLSLWIVMVSKNGMGSNMKVGIDMGHTTFWFLSDLGVEVNVPREKVEEWDKAIEAFNKCQDEMVKLYNEQRNI